MFFKSKVYIHSALSVLASPYKQKYHQLSKKFPTSTSDWSGDVIKKKDAWMIETVLWYYVKMSKPKA